ncbi:F-box/FBD/LRR-repeat protein At1g13570-like isoform X2 [Silene latifolia]|uniref:F-box/FBD/LRR-repeat protein At1g13570-like isoform X2 n=1 Tax=Silene latifolia TaxID=37657 RepID=UPI003D76F168
MACPETSTKMEDLISNVPDIVIDKILEKLPIRKAAQTSVLSKQWRHTWLSLKSLIFDHNFRKELKYNAETSNRREFCLIISSILLHHNGPVHDFVLSILGCDLTNHSQWISFLSKNGVRKIVIINWGDTMDLTSYIFRCTELVHLELYNFNLNPPPTDFTGFPYLKHLELLYINFTKQNSLHSLIRSCKMLATLKLDNWSGMDHIVIDAPSLQTLILIGDFESLAFGNVRSLKSISLHLTKMPKKLVTVETIDAVNLLASSSQLQTIQFGGYLCQFLAEGGIIRSPPDTFNHLDKLCLTYLDLSDYVVFSYLLAMIECCPCIKKLDISVIPDKNVGPHILDYNYKYNYKLNHLLEISIKGITGSIVELKLVEYLLVISVVLENMFFEFGNVGIESELKMSKALMRFPRASTKASLVCH